MRCHYHIVWKLFVKRFFFSFGPLSENIISSIQFTLFFVFFSKLIKCCFCQCQTFCFHFSLQGFCEYLHFANHPQIELDFFFWKEIMTYNKQSCMSHILQACWSVAEAVSWEISNVTHKIHFLLPQVGTHRALNSNQMFLLPKIAPLAMHLGSGQTSPTVLQSLNLNKYVEFKTPVNVQKHTQTYSWSNRQRGFHILEAGHFLKSNQSVTFGNVKIGQHPEA